MTEPRNNILCLLDVLGFESRLHEIGLENLHAKYEQLVQLVGAQSGGGVVGIDLPDGSAVATVFVQHAYFSDTLLFWMNYDPVKSQWFVRRMAEVVCSAIEIGLPLRGAITVGPSILNMRSGTFLGHSLIEAARLENQQQWIGASFGPSLAKISDHRYYLSLLQSYSSHYKDAEHHLATGLTLDWPRWWRETRNTDPREAIRRHDNTAAHSCYYVNTLKFIDHSMANVDWFLGAANQPSG